MVSFLIAVLTLLLSATTNESQTPATNSYVFPLIADGTLSGVVYRTTLKVLNTSATNPLLQCVLTQRQAAAQFNGLNGAYVPEIYDSGDHPPAILPIALDRYLPWEVLRSTAATRFQSGYAVLACSGAAHSETVISLWDARGTKLGETTTPPAAQGRSFTFLVDRRDGTRLGFAIANDSDIEGEYTLIARDEFNVEVDRAQEVLAARSQASRFVDEMLRLPANFVGGIEIVGVPGGRSYVVGLQFTGGVFATVQPLVRDTPLSF
jgi:hypothetical protein